MKLKFPPRLVAMVASLLLGPIATGAQIDIPLSKIKAPHNGVSDAEYGVSLICPTDWDVTRAARWGENNEKTTIVLQRTRPTRAAVNLFYQKFGGETQRPAGIREWFRRLGQEKEADKQKEFPDYRNDPESVTYGTTASGLPMCGYMATFTNGSGRLIEYYVRVAGETTYAMFVTQGTRSQIGAWRADIMQMADTVRLP